MRTELHDQMVNVLWQPVESVKDNLILGLAADLVHLSFRSEIPTAPLSHQQSIANAAKSPTDNPPRAYRLSVPYTSGRSAMEKV